MSTVDREQLKRAATDQAWDRGKDCEACEGTGTVSGGDRIIHSRKGGFGADWNLESVLKAIDEADDIQIGFGLFGPSVQCAKGSDVVSFDFDPGKAVEAP